ncbi:TPR domain protein [Minicystis rosea]|nr:TPR domain protein [Minicystis rosea]
MRVIVPQPSVTAAGIDAALLERGFARTADFPFENGIREIHYRIGEGRAVVVVGAQEGATVIRFHAVEAALAAEVARVLEAVEPAALIVAVREASEPRAAIRAIGRLAVVFYVPDHPAFEEALDAALARLTDPHALVRWTAGRVVPGTLRKVEAAFAAAKDRFPELTEPWESIRVACERKEDGTLGDGPTDDVAELARRAAEGAENKQWRRVALAAEAWLSQRPDSDEAAYFRAMAHRGLGEPLLALAWIAGAVWHMRLSAETERRMVEERPENGSLFDPARKEATAAAWQIEMDVIAVEARAAVDAAAHEDRLFAVFEGWAARAKDRVGGAGGALGAAAQALAGLIPGLDPLLAWLRVSTRFGATPDDHETLLREAEDSPWVWQVRAEHLAEDDFMASVGAWEEARRLLVEGAAPSPLAARIARLQALAGQTQTETGILEALMRSAYDRRDWDDAAMRADLLIERDPDSALAWQIRANARTFGLRHEEAVPAYDEALEALDRIIEVEGKTYLDDPRSALEFNRACVLAKLRRRAEALEGLRRAVKRDAKWAQRAAEDDYFEALWQDTEFLSIVRGDAAARLLAEEKTPAHVVGLLQRANAAMAQLDATAAVALASEALGIARVLDHGILRVSAGMIAGYVTVVKGDAEAGIALANEARAELDAMADADPAWRAEQLGEQVTVLLAAQRWEDAESVWRDALAARIAAFGEASLPVVLSYNQLTLIEIGRRASLEERAATLARGEERLRELLARTPDDAEAHAQRASFAAGRADLTNDAEARTTLMETAAEALEKSAALGGLRLQHVDKVLTVVEQTEAQSALRERLGAVHARLVTLLFPDPAEREERLFWRRIRHEVRALQSLGHDDASIAAALADLIRGQAPAMVRELGVFKGFAEHMARATAGYRMLAVMAPMALQTAVASGNVLNAIDQLEGLLLSGRDEDEDDGENEGDDE